MIIITTVHACFFVMSTSVIKLIRTGYCPDRFYNLGSLRRLTQYDVVRQLRLY